MKTDFSALSDFIARAGAAPALFKQVYANLKYRIKNFSETNRELAEYHFANENYADAVFRFSLLTRQQPKDAEGWAGLAASYVLNGQPEKAKRPLKIALKLAPENARALATRAYFEAPPST